MATQSRGRATRSSESRDDRLTLNAADRMMLVAHNGGRELGHAGAWCQTHVWMDGRVDAAALRAALARLAEQHPVVTSRLVEPGGRTAPYWRYDGGHPPTLHEIDVPGSSNEDVWREADLLLSTPLDHDRIDPITFHLLHLPDGRDMLIVRYSHVLMDGKAPESALRALDRCFRNEPVEAASDCDELQAHLMKFDGRARRRAAWQVIRSNLRWPKRSVTLVAPASTGWVVAPVRIRVASLDAESTAALTQHVRKLCGFANLTPAIAAAAFRAVGRTTPDAIAPKTHYQVDVPLNLRTPGTFDPIFHNHITFIQLRARQRDLEDRDDAIRLLNSQMRDQLRRGIDLGNLQMMSIACRYAGMFKRHIMSRVLRYPFTMGFGFLGPVTEELDTFCDRRVEWLYTVNGTISPPGVTLEVNQHRGRLNFILTHVEDTVPTVIAQRFLDEIRGDLGG